MLYTDGRQYSPGRVQRSVPPGILLKINNSSSTVILAGGVRKASAVTVVLDSPGCCKPGHTRTVQRE